MSVNCRYECYSDLVWVLTVAMSVTMSVNCRLHCAGGFIINLSYWDIVQCLLA